MLPSETGLMFKSYMDKITAFKDIDEYLDGKKKLDDKLDVQFAFISALTNKISKKPDDKLVSKWFDNKVKGMRDEVVVFGNVSVLNRHMKLVANNMMGNYWRAIDKDIQKKMAGAWHDLGYLVNDKM
jgi:G:T/U-mismatch repair DNA glycosylase